MQSFFAVAITLVARTAVGMVAYFAMAVAATRLGLVATASHQVAMQTFWFLSFFPEPLSMAAQTLLARFQGHAEASQVRAVLLVKSGAIMGVVLAAVVAGMFLFGTGIFTQDPAVQAAVRQLAPLGALAMAVCGVMMMFDGISIGSGAFRHLPALVGAGMVAVLGVLWYGLQTGAGLTAVWWGLCAFYGVRLAGHMLYYWASWPHNVFAGARRGTPKEPGNEGGPVVPAPAL